MEEQLISFETAKLAKEKGFNECCKNSYINRETLSLYHVAHDYYEYTCKEDFPLVKDCINFFAPIHLPWYKVPSQSLLQKWLRDVHQIEIHIDCITENNYIDKIII